ncbi:hypothetical protein E8K88_04575 [Lampropedia aestuarii]|uniref:Uncharacterized protein n=1 Tax=Lampropedia aestuarii TaxID=2562762 RepID=A0A4S5BVR4_9BURK|nr:hypothetical protein [Lampropedia aestuarii]THJ35271.1 hypothetical protein E8K88_04575 [Lampropedia aestuarii]
MRHGNRSLRLHAKEAMQRCYNQALQRRIQTALAALNEHPFCPNTASSGITESEAGEFTIAMRMQQIVDTNVKFVIK